MRPPSQPLDIQAIKDALGITGFATTESIIDAINAMRNTPTPPPAPKCLTLDTPQREPVRECWNRTRPGWRCPFARAVSGCGIVTSANLGFALARAAVAGEVFERDGGEFVKVRIGGRTHIFALAGTHWILQMR